MENTFFSPLFVFHFFSAFFFPPYRENILKTAKALVEDTKLLVSGAASSQDKLAQAAQSSANTITQLAEVVKLGAASLGSDDPETQVRCFKIFSDTPKKTGDSFQLIRLSGNSDSAFKQHSSIHLSWDLSEFTQTPLF